jgi:hypothetical protein
MSRDDFMDSIPTAKTEKVRVTKAANKIMRDGCVSKSEAPIARKLSEDRKPKAWSPKGRK